MIGSTLSLLILKVFQFVLKLLHDGRNVGSEGVYTNIARQNNRATNVLR